MRFAVNQSSGFCGCVIADTITEAAHKAAACNVWPLATARKSAKVKARLIRRGDNSGALGSAPVWRVGSPKGTFTLTLWE